jgi:L-serine/L-threonine ammonia-lyase
MVRAIEEHGPSKDIHFYCSSGGNAGIACATAAIRLERKATIVVPLTTLPIAIAKLETLGAHVYQHGASWMEADAFMRTEFLDRDPDGVYVPPFDHPDIWSGAAVLVDELDQQIGDFDGIVCSVGGGGLFCGIMEGLANREHRLRTRFGECNDVQVLAVETRGADSLTQAVAKGEHMMLDGITSIATSLGARKVAKQAFDLAMTQPGVHTLALSDAEAAMATVRFAEDERLLVEVACGASLASVYNGSLRKHLGKGMTDVQWSHEKIVVVVCGGNIINLDMLTEYRLKYEQLLGANWGRAPPAAAVAKVHGGSSGVMRAWLNRGRDQTYEQQL